MASKPSERRHAREQLQDLNLTPIMSVIIILIPALLITASFFKLAILSVAAPKYKNLGVQQEDDDQKKKPLNLTVMITKDGYRISQEHQIEDSGKIIPMTNCTIDAASGEPVRSDDTGVEKKTNSSRCYDRPRLYAYLYSVKQRFPHEKVIIISAEPDTKWKHIAQTLDTTKFLRSDVPQDKGKVIPMFGSYDAYLKSFPKKGTCVYEDNHKDPKKRGQEYKCFKPLFPYPIFSVVE